MSQQDDFTMGEYGFSNNQQDLVARFEDQQVNNATSSSNVVNSIEDQQVNNATSSSNVQGQQVANTITSSKVVNNMQRALLSHIQQTNNATSSSRVVASIEGHQSNTAPSPSKIVILKAPPAFLRGLDAPVAAGNATLNATSDSLSMSALSDLPQMIPSIRYPTADRASTDTLMDPVEAAYDTDATISEAEAHLKTPSERGQYPIGQHNKRNRVKRNKKKEKAKKANPDGGRAEGDMNKSKGGKNVYGPPGGTADGGRKYGSETEPESGDDIFATNKGANKKKKKSGPPAPLQTDDGPVYTTALIELVEFEISEDDEAVNTTIRNERYDAPGQRGKASIWWWKVLKESRKETEKYVARKEQYKGALLDQVDYAERLEFENAELGKERDAKAREVEREMKRKDREIQILKEQLDRALGLA